MQEFRWVPLIQGALVRTPVGDNFAYKNIRAFNSESVTHQSLNTSKDLQNWASILAKASIEIVIKPGLEPFSLLSLKITEDWSLGLKRHERNAFTANCINSP